MDAGAGDRLSGWKEIALHLRRSVRSAQRWERELELPVHRVKTAHGQVVYASRSELDAWMARFGELPPDAHDAPDDEGAEVVQGAGVVTAVAPIAPPATRRRLFRWSYAGLLILAVVAYIAIDQQTSGSRGWQPLDLAFVGRALEARNQAGELLWSHPFDVDVSAGDPLLPRVRRASATTAEADLDGDGRLEYLVPVRFEGAAKSYYDVLFAFSDGGQAIWSLKADQVLSCGGETFRAPWRIYSVVVSSGPGPKRVWVALTHHTWWPSFVLEVTPDGEQTLRYVQAGWIYALSEWTTAEGNVLAAGGVMNEWARASVALVDLDGPVSMLPASDPRYRCDLGGAKAPLQVTLFPPLEASRALGAPYVAVQQLALQGQDLKVEIDNSHAVAALGPDTGVSSFEMSDDYWMMHDTLARAGKLDHMAQDCPERIGPREVRTWRPQQLWQSTALGRAVSGLPAQR